MIQRYSREKMSNIWTLDNKFQKWLDVEIASLRAWSKAGKFSEEVVSQTLQNAKFDSERISEIELETKHDMIAFTRNISESLGEEKKWFHFGLTSTDVVDTANAVLLKEANVILKEDLISFAEVLKTNALKYKNVACIGRTHGIHADITSFGLKWALYYDELQRHLKRFYAACDDVQTGKISGAVGNHCNVSTAHQDLVCEYLKINSANISTQVLQRDNHANYVFALSQIATFIEKIGIELRHLQRSEVREVFENFSKNQKGSSAMPHKKNPITSENMAGCARVMRGYAMSTAENNLLWHERDISHSSAERIILSDATILLDYMLVRFTKTLSNLYVDEQKMLDNIYITSKVIFSQRVFNILIDKGYSREEAYDTVQPLAIYAFENSVDFQELLKEKLQFAELDDCFTIDYYLASVDEIYKRVGI